MLVYGNGLSRRQRQCIEMCAFINVCGGAVVGARARGDVTGGAGDVTAAGTGLPK